jgi:hypothetical protein
MTQLALVDKITGEILEAAPDFQDFWCLYPRRVARKDALKAWGKLSSTQQVEAITALVDWRSVWAGKDLDYVCYPATWLNGERWTDELPPEFTARTAAHQSAQLPEQTARTVMPDHVRALLAKLRGGNAR